ncbi:hypothetical protein VI817_000050 [Penicillium citrinum]|nr:hypothetical protein VI817_000050 [Penicillium citrinum]
MSSRIDPVGHRQATSHASGPLVNALSRTLARREAKSARRRLTVLPKETIDFSSNDFLSLGTSSAFKDRYLAHLNNAPESFPFASGGSRLLDGNSHYAEELEQFVADFHQAPTALLFNSGFDANVGVLSSIPQPGDLILYDELIHASAHEGMRLSRAGKRIMFPHSSAAGMRDVLKAQIYDDSGVRDGTKNVFVVLESIYSMDGDVAPIKEFIDVVDELLPRQNGYFVVDEAHSTGVFGPRGAGVVQELGLQDRMFIRVHTFGKALASHGGKPNLDSGCILTPLDANELLCSHGSLWSRNERLFNQLCAESHLYYSVGFPVPCLYSYRIRAFIDWRNGTCEYF